MLPDRRRRSLLAIVSNGCVSSFLVLLSLRNSWLSLFRIDLFLLEGGEAWVVAMSQHEENDDFF